VNKLLPQLKIEHVWALVGIVGVFIFVNTHPIRPHDFWWHMAIGREIVTNGNIPSTDTFSYTAAGTPYASYKMFWLMEVLLYTIFHTGGAALVIFFQSTVITLAYILVLLTCYKKSHDWRSAAFGMLFAAALGMNDWNVRPQAITFLLGALFIFVIQLLRNGASKRWGIVFPLGMLLWVNSHGTFPLGLILIGLWLGDELWNASVVRWIRRERVNLKACIFPALIMLVSSLVCLVNPRGFGVIRYLQTLGGNPIVQSLVTEWAPPTFDTLGGSLFLGGMLLSAAVLALSPQRPSFFQLTSFLLFSLMGLSTSRGIIWFGIIMSSVLSEHIYAIVVRLKPKSPTQVYYGSRLINWIFTYILLGLAIVSLPWFKERLPFPEAKAGLISAETPITATNYLLEHKLPGNLFHAMSFGSYLIWEAQPDYPVFVDGRIELYSEDIWWDYLSISNAQGNWEERLHSYEVNTLMLSREEQPLLVEAIQFNNDWVKVYEDRAAVIFTSR
jgi:hypothetical protein